MTEELLKPQKPIALTFDDGPNTITTPFVLDKLEQYGIVASFFLVGNNINECTTKIVERESKLGCELCNHSLTHIFLGDSTKEIIKYEIQETSNRITDITGVTPKMFRPPYLAVNDQMYKYIELPFIGGLMCNDWEPDQTAKDRAAIILNNVKEGGIIVMHDLEGNQATVEALDEIIPELLHRGYEFVTVSQLFEHSGIDPDQKNKIWYNVFE